MKLDKETERYLVSSVKSFFADEMDEDIGDLKALRFLDYCIREIGPSIYNQAIADAQTFMQDKVSDLGGACYEPEFDFWRAHRSLARPDPLVRDDGTSDER
jgi:uncharacterized protein (DUF2164 family)